MEFVLLILMMILSLTPFVILGLMIASMWKIYEKAGENGVASIVPIYNLIILMDIVKKPRWWVVLMFIPIVNLAIIIIITNRLSKSFNKSTGFTIGLLFLGFVFYPILAFGDAQYDVKRLNY